MKKKIIGIVAAALLFGSSIGYAASTSLIGAKVTGLFTLQYSDKTKIADAVIINGAAYVPVRKMAEATGTELNVEGKTITLEDKANVVTSVEPAAPAATKTPVDLNAEKDKIEAEISKLQSGIKDVESNVLPGLKEQAQILSTNGAIGERAKQTLAQYEKQIETDKSRLASLQEQLAEINARIAAGE